MARAISIRSDEGSFIVVVPADKAEENTEVEFCIPQDLIARMTADLVKYRRCPRDRR